MPHSSQPIRMTGTTMFAAQTLKDLFKGQDLSNGGMLELPGWLVPEPENSFDPQAIAVHVQGERIGYLPRRIAAAVSIPRLTTHPCQVQLWGKTISKKFRVIGWVALGEGRVAWPHSLSHPPPMSPAEERAARAAAVSDHVQEALSSLDLSRRKQMAQGMVGRYHYLETIEPIRELKRQGRLEEALTLCYGAIQAAENDRDGREPAPAYTIEAAIIHRKLKQRDKEIAVLQRWLKLCPPSKRDDSRVAQRLRAISQGNDSRPASGT
jgi:hypothetical protein